MKKWENPELMILGVENTKEDMLDIEAKKWCPICKEHYAPGHGEHHCPVNPLPDEGEGGPIPTFS
ncbi:hypothetical protein [Clostridium sp. LIBA-8841]|uniref:hypothetical protein n=1 Tax=Clostridium sp. LIBA-8841 TaxID=2987530 RepID=UPI002AC739DA|nr:hypothetical protein [Clostridium sp. LIBA-8841]MDZ5254390.1 hypothetical protein [Clostridium sp. LIBA-8841]